MQVISTHCKTYESAIDANLRNAHLKIRVGKKVTCANPDAVGRFCRDRSDLLSFKCNKKFSYSKKQFLKP